MAWQYPRIAKKNRSTKNTNEILNKSISEEHVIAKEKSDEIFCYSIWKWVQNCIELITKLQKYCKMKFSGMCHKLEMLLKAKKKNIQI